MAADGYTLKRLVSIVAPAREKGAAARVARQVRHWTALDLLVPLAGKDTGTGVSRRYSADEIRKAAILVELSHYRIPAPVLEENFASSAAEWPIWRSWRDAVAGSKTVFFYMAYNEHMIAFQIAPVDAAFTVLQPKPGPKLHPAWDVVSAIVINLTSLFGRLKL